MKKIAVIYKSVYGTTKRYAEWIAEGLGAQLFNASEIKPAQLLDYDVVIYGGGLYAGGIIGSKLVSKNPVNSLVLFTVGLATPQTTDYSEILQKNFTPEQLKKMKVFHFQGGMDYKKLNILHRAMMAIMKKETENTPVDKRSGEDRIFLEAYGGTMDFTDKNAIKPLVEYVSAL